MPEEDDVNPFPLPRALGHRKAFFQTLGALNSNQLFPTQKFLCPGACDEPKLTLVPSLSPSPGLWHPGGTGGCIYLS